MAGADYRFCDHCGCKCFYDANLSYEYEPDGDKSILEAGVTTTFFTCDRLGDWAVLCSDCAKTHRTAIVLADRNSDLEALIRRETAEIVRLFHDEHEHPLGEVGWFDCCEHRRERVESVVRRILAEAKETNDD